MPVTLSGYELAYRGYGGVATVIPKEGETVPGLLWSITPECEESLDQYEGYPKLYHKADVTVTDPETGKQYHTMMYEMDPVSYTHLNVYKRKGWTHRWCTSCTANATDG